MNKGKHPVLEVVIIYLSCFVFRFVEYFLLRTDQTFWGEAFLHKLAGIVILYIAVKCLSSNLAYIGFTKANAFKYSSYGLLFGLGVFIVAYGVELLLVARQGGMPALQFYVSSYAVDGNVGNQTGTLFFLICIVGNIINVIMEEGVFRGLFQKILQQKYTFITSALLASLLFGFWHVIGPLRNYYDGLSTIGGMAANMLMLVITSSLVGFQFALMTKLTGSLYLAMGSHFVNNTIVNLLHVVSTTGSDELLFVRIAVAQTLSFLLVLFYYIRTQRRRKKV